MVLENQLELITPQILPEGCNFSEQQKAVIFADESINIVAGPGSGKTTVLIGKFALLLIEGLEQDQGICLITHTNVAVDEIKLGLKKIGINNIEYPHFIGTIQEFINTYFARKTFHLIHGEKNFRVLDDDEYKEKFDELFQRFKPDFYTYSTPNFKKRNPKLLISEDLSYSVTSDAPPSYKEAFEKSIKVLFDWGLVNNQQCLELALWYITKYEKPIRTAVTNRFKNILLDEAQDTSYLQYKILTKLFSSSRTIFQKFGDPYQALYNIFDGNNDAWVPFKEFNDEEIHYKEISESSRFGSSIANVLRSVCIEQYDTFRSLGLVRSFKPYFILYEDGEDLLQQYKGLIEQSEIESTSFLESNKKDTIVSLHHDDLTQLFKDYRKPLLKPRTNENEVKRSFNFLISLFSKEIDASFKEIKDKIDLNLDCKVDISKCIKELYSDSCIVEYIKYKLEKVLKYLTDNGREVFSKINIDNKINYYHQDILNSYYDESTENHSANERDVHIGTIHSVKGETHRSTLLVLDTMFRNYSDNTEYSMFELLQDYLLGNHIDPTTISNEFKRNETIKSLKLAYVALSRPTHLMTIAIPKHLIIDENGRVLNQMESKGWKRYESIIDFIK